MKLYEESDRKIAQAEEVNIQIKASHRAHWYPSSAVLSVIQRWQITPIKHGWDSGNPDYVPEFSQEVVNNMHTREEAIRRMMELILQFEIKCRATLDARVNRPPKGE